MNSLKNPRVSGISSATVVKSIKSGVSASEGLNGVRVDML